MKTLATRLCALAIACASVPLLSAPVQAQTQGRTGDDTTQLEAITVTGTRIKRAEVEGQVPVITITSKDIQASGLGSVGDILQRLSVSGSSLNTKFNSAGNFGFPPDGGGVGSGSATLSLRNLGAKRTLILVDGLRWVNESSASGVSAAVDLNTIPASIIDRIEILTDGASALYGSDAIAGVVNIITKKKQDGFGAHLYYGDYSTGDGQTDSESVSLGGSSDKYDFYIDFSHFNQNRISAAEYGPASIPVPGTGLTQGSSGTPTTRSVFNVPDGGTFGGLCPDGSCDITANGTAPDGIQDFPGGFHQFTGADRFNYAPFNLLLTPSRRSAVFAQGTVHLTDHINWNLKGLYNTRKSVNQAAPEPIFIGPGAGTGGLADTVGVDVSNPYNPFGFSLDAGPGGNLAFAGRRPVEGGPRVFSQDVDTKYFSSSLNGDFTPGDHQYFWDINYINSTNSASQTVTGTYNILHIKNALGPVDECVAPCVPLNFFGGPGSITQDMLDYILFTENDRSEQKLKAWTANISGDLFQLPAGSLDFAAGYEHRYLSGFYTPDSVVTAGETNGVPSLPTSGDYSVNEYYLEVNVPLLANLPAVQRLDLSAASRYSDYSTFGGTTNNKFGLRWQVVDQLALRGTYAEGFRAPSIGELFGSPARFDATLQDPCNGATGQTGANCAALGVPDPANFEQANTQISVRTGGNQQLQPETADSTTIGAVYSPDWGADTAWSQKLDFLLTYFKYKVSDAIQAPDAQTQLDRCVATLDPAFCDGISRGRTGDINGFDNTLQNLGRIDTKGYDIGVNWLGPQTGTGQFGAGLQATYTDSYRSVSTDTGLAEPNGVGVEVSNSAIPKWRSTLHVSWGLGDFSAVYTARYLAGLTESCAAATGYDICDGPNDTHHLGATTYHDIRATWKLPIASDFSLSAGINNFTDKDPPICLSCSLNGYDASTYDLPGRFGYVEADLKF